MTTIEPTLEPTLTFDFRKTQSKNRIKGLWLMMDGFRFTYLGATMALAGAALAFGYIVSVALTKSPAGALRWLT